MELVESDLSKAQLMVNKISLNKKMKLVLIEWEDSIQPISSWIHLSDFKETSVIKCRSVGWLIYDGRGAKAIAPNLGDFDNQDNIQASGVLRIPARTITKIKEIK